MMPKLQWVPSFTFDHALLTFHHVGIRYYQGSHNVLEFKDVLEKSWNLIIWGNVLEKSWNFNILQKCPGYVLEFFQNTSNCIIFYIKLQFFFSEVIPPNPLPAVGTQTLRL